MKILQICQFFTPERGGTAVVPYQISKYLESQGHEVTVITTNYHMEYAKFDPLDNVKIFAFPCVNVPGMLISTKMISEIKNQMRNFDLVHMHHFRTYPNIVAHYYAMKFNVSYVLQAHGSIPPSLNEFQAQKKLFDYLWGLNLLNDAKKLLALTNEERTQYMDMGVTDQKIAVIPNGIDLLEYTKPVLKGLLKQRIKIGKNLKVILYFGRIHKRKGIEVLIHSFKDLSMDVSNIHLVIIGANDGYVEILKDLVKKMNISNNVTFLDPISEGEKYQAYRDADILVLPSKDEIFGLVPLEALMVGTPVVITKECGCSEYLSRFNYPYIVKYGDILELKESMKDLLNDPDIDKKILKAQMGIKENFNWTKIIKQIEGVYQICR